jgi:predicted 2-oxoglutarate/Fe(II)-dependent dioxygenase YbiX
MSDLDLVRQLGVFVAPEFIDGELCAALCAHIRGTQRSRAAVLGADAVGVDATVRRVQETAIRGAEVDALAGRLLELRPRLAEYFGVALADGEDLSFLTYEPGDFYRPHRDRAERDAAFVTGARSRRVSVVVFLNDGYGGGSLTLYGLVDDPKWRIYGFAVPAAAGMLVAFRADVLHEVTAVTSGERLTAVSWFHA